MRRLFLLAWLVSVYTGESNAWRVWRTEEYPKFVQNGNWLHFYSDAGQEIYISGKIVSIKKEE